MYSCFEGNDDKYPWKKTKIEIQLRTELQHAWATSLEIIDTLENIKLKTSNEGHEEWRRFFYICGCLVAHDEKACLLAPDQVKAYEQELKALEDSLSVKKKLGTYVTALNITTDENLKKQLPKNHRGHYLVTMRSFDEKLRRFTVSVEPFRINQAEDALDALKRDDANPDILIAVLLAADNMRSLKNAYPNYFGSTNQFTRFITRHIK